MICYLVLTVYSIDYLVKELVERRLRRMKKTLREYNTLGEFYVDVYNKYHTSDSTKKILEIQKIMYDKNKVWYSMIDVIYRKKLCMKKVYIKKQP